MNPKFLANHELANAKLISPSTRTIHVMRMLGHKKIENTMIHTQFISSESDQSHVRTAKTLKEACDIVETGFEYVTDLEDCEILLKRK